MPSRLLLPLLFALLILLVGVLGACDTVTVTYGEATYQRSTLFSDKAISEVAIEQTEDGFKASLGKSDTTARVEVLEAVGAVLEAARE